MTTDLSAAFLRAICENPHDHGTRLVFADWLEEHGQQEREEFIRVQIELDKTLCHQPLGRGENRTPYNAFCNDSECHHCNLERRSDSLLGLLVAAANGVRTCEPEHSWLPQPLQSLLSADEDAEIEWEWRRGFVEHVELPTAAFIEHAKALFRAAPITSVRLMDREPDGREYANHFWRWYCSWDMLGTPSREDALKAPAAPAHLPGVIWEAYVSLYPHGTWNHKSPAAAHAALNAACVTYARRLVGLPDLPREALAPTAKESPA